MIFLFQKITIPLNIGIHKIQSTKETKFFLTFQTDVYIIYKRSSRLGNKLDYHYVLDDAADSSQTVIGG